MGEGGSLFFLMMAANEKSGELSVQTAGGGGERFWEIDTLRGLTMGAMITVNNPGDWSKIYPPFRHSSWHGCTFADLIFPFFLFIVGVSVICSLSARQNRGESRREILSHIFRRSFLLFFLGVLLNAIPDFDLTTVRIPGVLQRIAIVYLFSAIAGLYLPASLLPLLTGLLLFLGWLLLVRVPVPGVGPPSLEPARDLGSWLDRTLLTGHLWRYSRTWDPEGILSTLPATANGLLGLFGGHLLYRRRLFIAGHILPGALLVVGGILWSHTFPLNKSLWTGSFALFTSGIALIILVTLRTIRRFSTPRMILKPFEMAGRNAILLYLYSAILSKTLQEIVLCDGRGCSLKSVIYRFFYLPFLPDELNSLIWGGMVLSSSLLIAWLLHRRRLYWKL